VVDVSAERRIVIAALAWFFIAILPAYIFEHFVPSYLFCPVVGLSIGIAAIAMPRMGR